MQDTSLKLHATLVHVLQDSDLSQSRVTLYMLEHTEAPCNIQNQYAHNTCGQDLATAEVMLWPHASCTTRAVWSTLYGSKCVAHTVWFTLHASHCTAHIVGTRSLYHKMQSQC